MISASGFFRGWTTWTTGWASKNEDLLPRYLVLSIWTTPKPLNSTHSHSFNAKPDLIVDHHDHSLCFPASSFLVYPRRKLFSSWKVCKCKTASLSDWGGTILNAETHTNTNTKTQIWILNRTNISSFKRDFLILLSADERFSGGIRFSQLFEWSLLINCLRVSDWSDNPITGGQCSLFIRTSCTKKLWLNIIHFTVIQSLHK